MKKNTQLSPKICLLPLLAVFVGCATSKAPRAADGLTDTAYMQQSAHIECEEVGRFVENRPRLSTFGFGDDVTLFSWQRAQHASFRIRVR